MHGKRCVQCRKKAEEKCDGCGATCCEAHQYELIDRTKVCVQCFRDKFGVAYAGEQEKAVLTFWGLWIVLSVVFANVATYFDYGLVDATCNVFNVFCWFPIAIFGVPFGIAMVASEFLHRGKNSLRGQYPQYDPKWSH